ncbi:hypothetical protein TNCV_2540661 [Trichonephila clavipes]|nr:hypothetical protein TNCV_2540661 [Trichonephila clavipes]
MYRWPVIVPFTRQPRRHVWPLIIMPAHTMILHVGYQSFSWIFFWTISSTTLAPDQLASQSDDRLNLLSSENTTHAQSCSVNCDAHDTISNGQYGAVWSMGHTQ